MVRFYLCGEMLISQCLNLPASLSNLEYGNDKYIITTGIDKAIPKLGQDVAVSTT